MMISPIEWADHSFSSHSPYINLTNGYYSLPLVTILLLYFAINFDGRFKSNDMKEM